MSNQFPPQAPQQPYQSMPQVPQYQQAPQQGTYQPLPPYQPQPVFQPLPPKKKSHKAAWIGIILVVLFLGFIASNVSKIGQGVTQGIAAATAPASSTAQTVPAQPPVPARTVTVTAPAKDSSNVARMKVAWKNMTNDQKAGIRETWAEYKDSPNLAAVYVNAFQSTMNDAGYTFTEDEVIEFFNWTLTN